MTSSACSTPCRAKYCASALSSAWSAATSALMVSSPRLGGQSRKMTSKSPSIGLSALRNVSSRPILPASATSASASCRLDGMTLTPSGATCSAAFAFAAPTSTSRTVGSASGSTSK
jgi:hypothetical protein